MGGVWCLFAESIGLCGERGSCGIHVPSIMSLEIRGQEGGVWAAEI